MLYSAQVVEEASLEASPMYDCMEPHLYVHLGNQEPDENPYAEIVATSNEYKGPYAEILKRSQSGIYEAYIPPANIGPPKPPPKRTGSVKKIQATSGTSSCPISPKLQSKSGKLENVLMDELNKKISCSVDRSRAARPSYKSQSGSLRSASLTRFQMFPREEEKSEKYESLPERRAPQILEKNMAAFAENPAPVPDWRAELKARANSEKMASSLNANDNWLNFKDKPNKPMGTSKISSESLGYSSCEKVTGHKEREPFLDNRSDTFYCNTGLPNKQTHSKETRSGSLKHKGIPRLPADISRHSTYKSSRERSSSSSSSGSSQSCTWPYEIMNTPTSSASYKKDAKTASIRPLPAINPNPALINTPNFSRSRSGSTPAILEGNDGTPFFSSLSRVPLDLSELSVESVTQCLQLLNMAEYSTIFQEMQIDGGLLVTLDTEMLMGEFGMKRFAANKLMQFAKGWRPK